MHGEKQLNIQLVCMVDFKEGVNNEAFTSRCKVWKLKDETIGAAFRGESRGWVY